MAERVIEAREFTCDGCGKKRLSLDEMLPNGYHGGNVTRVTDGGGQVATKWFACQSRCIGKAIATVIDRSNIGVTGGDDE